MTRIFGMLCGALLAFGATAASATAQRGRVPAGRVPVTVAVTDSANFGQEVVILRRPDAARPNIILMARSSATPRHLAAAAATLSVIMQREGDRPSVPGLYRVSAEATAPAGTLEAARQALARAETAVKASLGIHGVAPARTTRIYLPDGATRDALQRDGRMQLRARRTPGGGP